MYTLHKEIIVAQKSNLEIWIKERLGNLLQAVGSKRVVVGALAVYAVNGMEGISPNVKAVCMTILGLAYIASEAIDKLKK